jgi:DNA helicase-2/ATP-dependent DNA helicase PcrA
VHVIHLADGNLPSDLATGDHESIEEERRLLYVAVTRARDRLHCYAPLRYHRHRGDSHGYAQLSRFLTPAVLATVDQETRQPAQGDDPAADHRPMAAVDDLVAALWD